MAWLKNVLIDLVVTAIIVLLAWQDWRWAEVAVWIYTPLMAVLKGVVLVAGGFGGLDRGMRGAPVWFYHAVYATNTGVLALDGRWILAGLWVLIWALSVIAERRASPQAA